MITPSTSMTGEAVTHNKLGTLNGVFVPCCLNILGTILFLRLGFSIGQAGWFGTFGIFAIGEVQTFLTVLSVAAIVTNGNMRGGGSYFMISRSLGPELGGSIGVLFYLAYAMGAAFYAIGMASEFQTVVWPDVNPNSDEGYYLLGGISSAVLFVVLIVSLLGAGFFTKINVFLFAIQFGSILAVLVSMYTREPDGVFLGFSWDNLKSNFWPQYSDDYQCPGKSCSFRDVFGIVFPAVTGIMEGANLSGDLKNPSKSIGRGTMGAVIFAFIIYVILWTTMAASFSGETLRSNMFILQDVCIFPQIVITGVLVATSSSALGSVFGGSRILQALGQDEILPGLKFFAKGSKNGNEPRRAVVATWLLAQCFVWIGDIDVVAPIATCFFCITYAMVNLTCFLLKVSGTVNFRPSFKYWHPYLSLFGFFLNMAVMAWLNVVYCLIAIVLLVVVFVWVLSRDKSHDWGDVSQAIIFHQVRKYLLRLDETKNHAKTWRPSLLLLVDDFNGPMTVFCNHLKKGGLYILGNVIVGDLTSKHKESVTVKDQWNTFIKRAKIKAFSQTAISETLREGYSSLMILSGLGAMTPNTIVTPMFNRFKGENQRISTSAQYVDQKQQMPHPRSSSTSSLQAPLLDEADDVEGSAAAANISSDIRLERLLDGTLYDCLKRHNMAMLEYFGTLGDAMMMGKNVIIGCNFDMLSGSDDLPRSRSNFKSDCTMTTAKNTVQYIDFWAFGVTQSTTQNWEEFETKIVFCLQLAHIYKLSSVKKRSKKHELKVRCIVVLEEREDLLQDEHSPQPEDQQALEESLAANIEETRLDVDEVLFQTLRTSEAEASDQVARLTAVNKLIQQHSADTHMIFMNLPALPAFDGKQQQPQGQQQQQTKQMQFSLAACENYTTAIEALQTNLPPISLCRATPDGDRERFMSVNL